MALTKVKPSNILLTTPAASSNDVTPATTEYVTTAIANMVDSAPSTLNTLNELAAALGDDANFSTTVTNSIAAKLPLAGGTLTGDLTLTSGTTNKPKLTITNTNADSTPPYLILKKDSSSPADNDEVGRIYMYGDDDAGNATEAFLAIAKMTDVSDGSEDSSVDMYTYAAGSQTKTLTLKEGKIGIGTTTPSEKLHLGGAAPGDSIIRQDATSSGTNWEIGERSAGNYQFWEDDGDNVRLTITSTGDVRVGPGTSRGRKFVVEGTGDLMALYSTNSGAGGAQFDLIHDSSSYADDDSVGIINFSTDNRQLASIKGVGQGSGDRGVFHIGVRKNSSNYTHDAFRLENIGDEIYADIYSPSGSNRGAGYFRFKTDGSSTDQSVAQIYMEQGSGDGGSRKCNMYFQVSDNGNPSTAMTIANNKNVGIGTSNPGHPLHIVESADGTKLRLTRGGVCEWDFSIGNTSTLSGVGSGALELIPQNANTANEFAIGTAGSSAALFHLTNSQNYFQKMVLIGDASQESGDLESTKRLYLEGEESVAMIKNTSANGSSNRVSIGFLDSGGTRRGYIYTNNSTADMVTSSDYRMKENVTPMVDGLSRVNALKPVKFKWKHDDYYTEGFLAHEIQEAGWNEGVTGEKDGEEMQAVAYGRITPLLVKAIQELKTELDAAKARITELET